MVDSSDTHTCVGTSHGFIATTLIFPSVDYNYYCTEIGYNSMFQDNGV